MFVAGIQNIEYYKDSLLLLVVGRAGLEPATSAA
jgi:hypothetical protein